LLEDAPNDGVEKGVDALVVGPGGARPNVITIDQCGREERVDVRIQSKEDPVYHDDGRSAPAERLEFCSGRAALIMRGKPRKSAARRCVQFFDF